MDLPRLRHILAVADARSFSRAAEAVHITQPALSRSIAAFEQEHGVRLFDRGRAGVVPTTAGRLVVERARALLASARELEDSLSHYARGEEGDVAIGLGPMAAGIILPELSRRLLRQRPRLRLIAAVKPPAMLLDDLMNDRLELFFGNTWQIGEHDVEAQPVATVPLAMIVRAGHPLAGRRGLTLTDLAEFPMASSVERPVAGMAGGMGGFVCDNFHVLRDAVLDSDCAWLASPAFVTPELDEGRLVVLDLVDLPYPASQIGAVRRRGRTMSPAARVVLDEVRSILNESDAG